MVKENMLKNKKILMFSNTFFNYENFIVEKLKANGATVDFYNERPSDSLFIKGIIRVKKDLLNLRIKKYYINILKEIEKKKYDILFVIKGEVIPKFFIQKLIQENSGIELFYYNYDSFTNNPHALDILHLFHYKYTFDLEDADKHNMFFRPLFYCDIYGDLKKSDKKQKYSYDMLFVGTAHSDRYIIAEEVKKIMEESNRTAFNYYYIQSKWVYWYKKIFDASFSAFDYKKLFSKKLSHSQIAELYKKSNCILDINHPNQQGLTMRTFETLGAGKKLITTNHSILKYKLYNPNNVMIIDRASVQIDDDFFCSPFLEYTAEEFYRMSLNGWIEDIFIKKKSYSTF